MSANTNWVPYKIPATPSSAPPPNSVYALGLSELNSSKNPSQFLRWQTIQTGLPTGATTKQIDICENGNPQQYWFLVWGQEPQV